MADEKKPWDALQQPIAALLEHWKWLGDQPVGNGGSKVTYNDLANDLENAIADQVGWWELERRAAIGYEEQAYERCIGDLKGEPRKDG